MKKKIILVVCLFILTGCNVQYNITINKDSINDYIEFNSENDKDNYSINMYQMPVNSYINDPISDEIVQKLPGVEYYNMNKILDDNYYKMTLNYLFPLNKYQDNYIINHAINGMIMTNEKGIISIYTGDKIQAFNYYEFLNNLTISINVSNDFEIIENNADLINENNLIWYVNRNNFQNKPINIVLKDKNYKEEDKKPISNANQNNTNKQNGLLVALSLFLSFVLFLGFIIFLKRKLQK